MIEASRKLLIIGGNGMLARAVAAQVPPGYDLHAVDLPEFDMTDSDQIDSIFDEIKPDIVVNCAAYTNVDSCETDQDLASQVNGTAVGYLASAARRVGTTLVHVSTDYVFDGLKDSPYKEDDPTGPQSVYGQTKLQGEEAILASGLDKYFIVRTSWLYGPKGNNFVETILRLASEREELRIIHDQVGSPTYTIDLAAAILTLIDVAASSQSSYPSPYGIYHFSNSGQCSWYEFAVEIVANAKFAGLPLQVKNITPIRTEEYPLPAKRPAYSVFDKSKFINFTGAQPPQWQDSLKEYFKVR